MLDKPTYVGFEIDKYHWKPDVDYKQNPLEYRIGRGQQGVLICEPYKSELYPLWRFKTPDLAQHSCEMIYNKFLHYIDNDDFVGADMLRNTYIWDLLVVVDIGIIHQELNGRMKMVNGVFYHTTEKNNDSWIVV